MRCPGRGHGSPTGARIQAYRKPRKRCYQTIVSGVERKGYNAFLD